MKSFPQRCGREWLHHVVTVEAIHWAVCESIQAAQAFAVAHVMVKQKEDAPTKVAKEEIKRKRKRESSKSKRSEDEKR